MKKAPNPRKPPEGTAPKPGKTADLTRPVNQTKPPRSGMEPV